MELKKEIENDKLFDALSSVKEKLRLDLDIQNFDNQCFSVNALLNKNGLFLKVYELKENFRYLIKQAREKNKVLRELSSCVIEKCNSFSVVRVEFGKKLRQSFHSIVIIYKPVKRCDEIINCFFSEKLNLAFRTSFSEGAKIKYITAWQCYFCSKYFGMKDRSDQHFENCSGRHGYVYNFNTENMLTFEENLKYKGDIPLIAYVDFETTAPKNDCINPENRAMFAVSYVMNFALHPELDINRVIIEHSFGHSREKLTSLNYLMREQLKVKDRATLLQLRDCTLAVANKS